MSGTVPSRALPLQIKLANGFGAVAFGVKDTGFSVFLLLYYNQVLGMPATLVSLALFLALLVDGIVDPLIGNLGDRTYTRWGRRLPWLYCAALPLAVVWAILWAPPVNGTPSFWGLLGIAILVRLLLSACEVPSTALVPELTKDYDERTTLFRYRFLFGWAGGLTMILLAYTVFLPGDAQLQPQGYASFGLFGGALIFISVMASALGQHRRVAHLPAIKPGPFTVKGTFSEIIEAFSERAFLFLAAGAIGAFISQGMTFSMKLYLYNFVWEFSAAAFVFYPIVLFLSVVIVFLTLGPLHRRFGKHRVAAVSTLIALVLWTTPYLLRLAGIWPEIGDTASHALVYAFVLGSNVFAVMVMVSASSMVADIVEAFEERSGRRAEGSFFSGYWFIQKCATGLGILLSGLIVDAAGIPNGAQPGEVASRILDNFTILYVGVSIILALFSAYWLNRFPIHRADHEARIASLSPGRGNNNGEVDPAPANP
ncbi:MFS transporter [Pontixanthobacter sp.]|uniref:MFS transporter n=1 Tax=Pontixanthobacter sp. TaxID=2792078 RepID=UPI003C7BF114